MMAGENELGRFMPFIDIVIQGQKLAANTMEAVRAQYDAIQTGVDRLSRRFSTIEQQQITFVYDVKELSSKFATLVERSEARHKEVSEHIDTLSGLIDAIYQKLSDRMDAILARLDEMEDRIDMSRDEKRLMHLEIVGQYHEVLNAIQIGSNARSDLAGAIERIELLERKLGL